MKKKIIASLFVAAILSISVIVGTIVYFNSVVSEKNSAPSSIPVPSLTPSPTPTPVATFSPTTNSPNENLTITNVNDGGVGTGGLYNWNLTATIENNGDTTAVITNIIIDGQLYSSMNPVPLIMPSIRNGYSLSPNQTVTITILDTNATTMPFHNGGKIYLLTATGNSYLIWQSSG